MGISAKVRHCHGEGRGLKQKTSPKEIVKLLGQRGIWIRDLEDPACLRACFHVTSKSEEVQMLNQAIKELANTQ